MQDTPLHSAVVQAQGHLIDSQLLNTIFDTVIERGGQFEVLHFEIGRTNDDFSRLRLKVSAASGDALRRVVEELIPLGCHAVEEQDAVLKAAEHDGAVPDDFYSTTNMRTEVRVNGRWEPVGRQRMDAVIAVENGTATCRKLREIKRRSRRVRAHGLRVTPEICDRGRHSRSCRTRSPSAGSGCVARIVQMRDTKRVASGSWWPGLSSSTPAAAYFNESSGSIPTCCCGTPRPFTTNRHCPGTSLGSTGGRTLAGRPSPPHAPQRHQPRRRYPRGGRRRRLTSGVMVECVRAGVDYVASIRDDGPLPDTITDVTEAQDRYAEALASAGMVIVLSTMLHGIGVGNMLPAWVPVVCVDINPAVVTKLADRGSSQTIGLVTDVGLFLHQLARRLA